MPPVAQAAPSHQTAAPVRARRTPVIPQGSLLPHPTPCCPLPGATRWPPAPVCTVFLFRLARLARSPTPTPTWLSISQPNPTRAQASSAAAAAAPAQDHGFLHDALLTLICRLEKEQPQSIVPQVRAKPLFSLSPPAWGASDRPLPCAPGPTLIRVGPSRRSPSSPPRHWVHGAVNRSSTAKLMERCSDGGEDQGAEEALRGQERIVFVSFGSRLPCERLSFQRC